MMPTPRCSPTLSHMTYVATSSGITVGFCSWASHHFRPSQKTRIEAKLIIW
jgi:hypothetical protein